MEYTKEFLATIVHVGILGYPLSKILNIFDIEETNFSIDFYTPGSALHSAYNKGIDKADYIIDSKLFEMAKEGDLKALEKFEARKRINEAECKKQQRQSNFKP